MAETLKILLSSQLQLWAAAQALRLAPAIRTASSRLQVPSSAAAASGKVVLQSQAPGGLTLFQDEAEVG